MWSLRLVKSIMLIFLVTLFSLVANAVDKPLCDNVSDRIPRLASSSGEILKKTNVEYAEKDMKDFCKRNMLLRYLKTKKSLQIGEIDTLSTEQLEKVVDQANSEIAPWQLSLLSTENSKKKAVEAIIWNDDPLLYFSKPKREHADYAQASAFIDSATSNQSTKIDDIKTKTALLCAYEMKFSAVSCVKSLEAIQEKMIPKGGDLDITDKALWKRVLGSDKYDEGLRIAASTIAQKVKSSNGTNGNIFEDIQNAFIKSGMNSNEAQNATWDTLGLIANQGPSIGYYVTKLENRGDSSLENSQKSNALAYIASGMTYLDLKNLKNNLPMYSYPSGIQTTCDNSKPYHFWMSAYLARTLVKENQIAPEVAAETTFMAQKAYQINRTAAANGTQPGAIENILATQPYAPVRQIIRTDLAYSSAGALYGSQSAESLNTKNYSVNGAIVSLLKDSSSEKTEPGTNMLETYLKWNRAFSADSAFEYLKN
jgi:hypothetical protein